MSQTMRALVIHRDRELCHRLAEGLAEYACETFQAIAPTEGLALTSHVRPDLIFLEVVADQDDGWKALSRIRLITDVLVLLLADQPPKPVHQALCKKNVAVLVQPISVTETIAKAIALCKPPIAARPHPIMRQRKKWIGLPLQVLRVSQVLAIDRALQEIGSFGEVRLVVQRGHLRFLAKLKTETIEPAPVISKETV